MIHPTSMNPSHSGSYSLPPLPESLSAFSAQQIDSLHVPQNRVEIEKQELIVLATLPTNDLLEWELKKSWEGLGL
ncbi:hypothetical protein L873DRAFT_1817655, partial [Choiromyces venosus 120613-1]